MIRGLILIVTPVNDYGGSFVSSSKFSRVAQLRIGYTSFFFSRNLLLTMIYTTQSKVELLAGELDNGPGV